MEHINNLMMQPYADANCATMTKMSDMNYVKMK